MRNHCRRNITVLATIMSRRLMASPAQLVIIRFNSVFPLALLLPKSSEYSRHRCCWPPAAAAAVSSLLAISGPNTRDVKSMVGVVMVVATFSLLQPGRSRVSSSFYALWNWLTMLFVLLRTLFLRGGCGGGGVRDRNNNWGCCMQSS